jgi:hypothetical protein
VAIFTEFGATAGGNEAKELRQCRRFCDGRGVGVVVLGLAFEIFSPSLVTDNLLDCLLCWSEPRSKEAS